MKLLDRFFTHGNPRLAWEGEDIVAGVLRRRVGGGAGLTRRLVHEAQRPGEAAECGRSASKEKTV